MVLLILLLASYLYYMGSKYFPGSSMKSRLKLTKYQLNSVASLLVLVAWWLLYLEYEVLTAFIYLLFAIGTLLSALVITLKLSMKWNYVWAAIGLLSLLVDFL